MRRISIDVVGLAVLGGGCGGDFEPATPWIILAQDEPSAADDGGSDGAGLDDAPAGDDGGGAEASGEPPPPGDDGGGLDDGAGGEVSSGGEVGDGPQDSPYQGGWDIGDCQNDIAAATNDPGGAIGDFTFSDQFGEQVRLYDFCHKAILMVEGAFW